MRRHKVSARWLVFKQVKSRKIIISPQGVKIKYGKDKPKLANLFQDKPKHANLIIMINEHHV